MTPEEKRLTLHSNLKALFPDLDVIFRPDQDFGLKTPCVVYDLKNIETRKANNKVYIKSATFNVTVLSSRGAIFDSTAVLDMPRSGMANTYSNNDIVHDVYVVTI